MYLFRGTGSGRLFQVRTAPRAFSTFVSSDQHTGISKSILPIIYYKYIYKSIDIQPSFVIPQSPQWPENLWNFPLGEMVVDIKNQLHCREDGHLSSADRKILRQLGFEPDGAIFQKAFTHYRMLNGKDIPYDFVVPRNVFWPEEMWGLKLGSRILFYSKAHINVIFPPKLALNSFQTYLNLTKSKYISSGFVVPANETWPSSLHGIDLGTLYVAYCKQYLPLEEREMIENIGMVAVDMVPFEIIKEALQYYFLLYGKGAVPSTYEVPCGDDSWPSHLWGVPLGFSIGSMLRCHEKTTSSNLQELLSMGLFTGSKEDNFPRIVEALTQYRQLYGDLNIPSTFIVPPTADWDSGLWGMRLGYTVSDIRRGLSYKGRKELFAEMGLKFFETRYCHSFAKILRAIEYYRSIHGHAHVSHTFRFSHGKEVPKELRGFHLGLRVYHIFKKKHFADRQRELQALGVNSVDDSGLSSSASAE